MLPFPTGYDPGLKGLLDSYVAGLAFTRGIDIAAMLLFTGFFFSPVGLALLTRGEVGEAARSRTAGEVTGESA